MSTAYGPPRCSFRFPFRCPRTIDSEALRSIYGRDNVKGSSGICFTMSQHPSDPKVAEREGIRTLEWD
jgi:hypothetical protein